MCTIVLKIGKTLIKAIAAVFRFCVLIILDTFIRYGERREDFNQWQNDYDEYTKKVTGKGPFG